MTREEFLQAVRSSNIRSDAFRLSGQGNECYVLTDRAGGWVVHYAERGLETGVRHFLTESAALEHLLKELRSDPTTRR